MVLKTIVYAGKTNLPRKIYLCGWCHTRNGTLAATKKTAHRPHGLKYRLYYGLADGTCVVRYGNETGKGDHRHIEDDEEPYRFTDVETLVSDFLADIEKARRR